MEVWALEWRVTCHRSCWGGFKWFKWCHCHWRGQVEEGCVRQHPFVVWTWQTLIPHSFTLASEGGPIALGRGLLMMREVRGGLDLFHSFSSSFSLCQQRMFLLKSEKCWPQRDKVQHTLKCFKSGEEPVVISCSQIDRGLVNVCQTSTHSNVECRNHLASGYNIYPILPRALLASLAQFEMSTGSQIPR